jgi:hypothetical protein
VALLASDPAAQGATDAVGKLLGVIVERQNSWIAPEFARRIADLAARRQALATVQQAARNLFARDGDWREHMAGAGVTLAILDERGSAAYQAAHKTTWTAAELLATQFPEPRWAVPDLVPVGLSFLAGRPKVGKSWLALQMAIAVGTGGRVLDNFSHRQTGVSLAPARPAGATGTSTEQARHRYARGTGPAKRLHHNRGYQRRR